MRLSSRCFARGSRCDGIRCCMSQRHQAGVLSDVAGLEFVEGRDVDSFIVRQISLDRVSMVR